MCSYALSSTYCLRQSFSRLSYTYVIVKRFFHFFVFSFTIFFQHTDLHLFCSIFYVIRSFMLLPQPLSSSAHILLHTLHSLLHVIYVFIAIILCTIQLFRLHFYNPFFSLAGSRSPNGTAPVQQYISHICPDASKKYTQRAFHS